MTEEVCKICSGTGVMYINEGHGCNLSQESFPCPMCNEEIRKVVEDYTTELTSHWPFTPCPGDYLRVSGPDTQDFIAQVAKILYPGIITFEGESELLSNFNKEFWDLGWSFKKVCGPESSLEFQEDGEILLSLRSRDGNEVQFQTLGNGKARIDISTDESYDIVYTDLSILKEFVDEATEPEEYSIRLIEGDQEWGTPQDVVEIKPSLEDTEDSKHWPFIPSVNQKIRIQGPAMTTQEVVVIEIIDPITIKYADKRGETSRCDFDAAGWGVGWKFEAIEESGADKIRREFSKENCFYYMEEEVFDKARVSNNPVSIFLGSQNLELCEVLWLIQKEKFLFEDFEWLMGGASNWYTFQSEFSISAHNKHPFRFKW